MATEKIERTIQYFGLLKIPATVKKVKWWRLTADIIRPPISEYRNDKYPVPQGFFGYVQCMYAGRVLHTYRISYKNEILAYDINTDLFLHQSVSCALEAILTSFVNFAINAGDIPIERNNPIKNWKQLSFPVEEFKIRLLTENTIFRFIYEYELQEDCAILGASPIPDPPPKPPDKPPSFPPNATEKDVPSNSPSYEGPNDNGETYKPGPDTPTTGEECAIYDVNYTIRNPGNENFTTINATASVLGIVDRAEIQIQPDSPNYTQAVIICGGAVNTNCVQGTAVILATGLEPTGASIIITAVNKK